MWRAFIAAVSYSSLLGCTERSVLFPPPEPDDLRGDRAGDSGPRDIAQDVVEPTDAGPEVPSLDAVTPPARGWARGLGGSSSEEPAAVAVDRAGNIVIVGRFKGSVDFGGGPLVSAGSDDIFIASYTADGVHRWSSRFGDDRQDLAQDVAMDDDGNVTVVGTFDGSVDFGGGALAAGVWWDNFVASFDQAGLHRWSRTFSGGSMDSCVGIEVSPDGDAVITGCLGGWGDFGGGLLEGAGGTDVFLVRYNAAGVHQWSRGFGASGNEKPGGVAVGRDGAIYLAGYFEDTANLGGADLHSAGEADIFVASYDASGAHRWSEGYGGALDEWAYGIGVDLEGNTCVTGSLQSPVSFGGEVIPNLGGTDGFVASFDASGAHRWSHGFGGTAGEGGFAIAVDGRGQSAITGYFEGTVALGGERLVSSGIWDLFVACYGPGGAHLWSRRYGDTGYDWGADLAFDTEGDIVVLGTFTGTVDFGASSLSSTGPSSDLVLLKVLAQDP